MKNSIYELRNKDITYESSTQLYSQLEQRWIQRNSIRSYKAQLTLLIPKHLTFHVTSFCVPCSFLVRTVLNFLLPYPSISLVHLYGSQHGFRHV